MRIFRKTVEMGLEKDDVARAIEYYINREMRNSGNDKMAIKNIRMNPKAKYVVRFDVNPQVNGGS